VFDIPIFNSHIILIYFNGAPKKQWYIPTLLASKKCPRNGAYPFLTFLRGKVITDLHI
jgi:hypothetical protein